MKLKKIMSWVLLMTMSVSLFTGCGKSDTAASGENAVQSSESGSSEKSEVSVAFWDIENLVSKGADDKILQAIEDGSNVKIKPINTTWDDYRDKIQLWASSNQLPDMFAIDVIGSNYYYDWIEQGVVSPLPDDLSKWPTLQKYMSQPDVEALRAPDGKM
ncbi:MAG: extracellular solute-binding protein, partial [Lachnospiraceae bacterium]|nr:extracellular solute-binding protein [Lachnospiraceae bacterium]